MTMWKNEKVTLRQQLPAPGEWILTTLASIGDAVIATDTEGCVTFMNLAAEQLTGWSGSASLGQPLALVFSLVDERTRQPLPSPVHEVLEQRRPVEAAPHTLLQTKEGRYLPIDSQATPIMAEGGAVLGVVFVVRDSSERREKEAMTAAYAEQLRLIIDNVAGLISYVGADQRYRFANAAYQAWFGHSPPQIVGRHLREVIGGQSYATVEPYVQQALAGERVTFENTYLHTDGTQRTALVHYVPQRESGGGVSGFYVLLTDISERKQAEEERSRLTEQLHEINTTLAQQVAKRTEELEHSNRELARSNRELEQFAYVASHDLKTPLRAIDNLAQWITADAAAVLPAASREHLRKLRGRVTRMERLLDDLLAYSRAGRMRHSAEVIDLSSLLHDVLELLAPPADFIITLEQPLPAFIRTERVPLETVLRNLISNAIKHHHRTDGKIWITARETSAGIEFSVRDDGPGIDPAFHERIFELFQTLQPRDKVEGSGMGLALIKKIIESRGGTITLTSHAGAGATFRFLWKP